MNGGENDGGESGDDGARVWSGDGGDGDENSNDDEQPSQAKQSAPVQSLNSHCLSG